MIKKFIHLLAIPSILLMGACSTTKTAQRIDQNDDVYYSIAQAKEAAEVVEQPIENQKSDYVTDDELYGDAYGSDGYLSDYTARIYRFRNYSPSLNYYNSVYGYNYDPYYSSYYPYSYFGSPMISIGIGINNGYYNYNPWRYYGNNYGSNFWGPYSYYNSWNPYGYGGGYYGNNNYGGNYINMPVYSSPNYRPRPSRTVDNISIDRGAVTGGTGAIIKDGNGNVIQSRGRAERYGDEVRTGTTPRTSTARPQTTQPRPERVSQSQPQRATQPERISTAPRQDSGSQGGSAPSNSGGGRSGGDTGGARPSRGN